MNRSSWILTLAAGGVALALGVGGLAYFNSERVSAQSTSPSSTMAFIPAGASVVGQVNFSAIVNSPFREKWEEAMASERSNDQLEEFRAATGIDPFQDIERVSFAAVTSTNDGEDGAPGRMTERPESWGMAIRGSFDSQRLVAKIQEHTQFRVEDYEGTTIYFQTESPTSPDHDAHDGEDDDTHSVPATPSAFAFVDDQTVLIGESAYIKRMLDTAAGRLPSATTALDERWGSGTFMEDTFWIAAAPDSGFGGMIPKSGDIPPIGSVALSGRLDGELALRARGKAADDVAATKLADVVRGFVALGSLQRGENPDLGEVLDSVQIDQFDNEIDVSLQLAYDTLERWADRAKKTEAEKF